VLADARRLDVSGPLECDVCVVGGGPAGITLALELGSSGRSVCLLESGGLDHEPESQSLLAGEAAGSTYPPLVETRCAMLGGATGVWAGWCRPLDAIDFEPRDWVPGSGWPIPRDQLLACLPRAHELCGLGAPDYDADAWEARAGLARLPLRARDLEAAMFYARVWRFGTEHRPALERSPEIRVLLHATALKLERAAGSERIAKVRVVTLNGRRFDVTARNVVLAAGGIEHARVLLLSGEAPERAVGNDHGLVGRYFMEHASAIIGFGVPVD
jgi:choline dehydrogenase-like flavoprotein